MGQERSGRIELPPELLRTLTTPFRPPVSSTPDWERGGPGGEFLLECLRHLRSFICDIDEEGFIHHVSPTVADVLGWSPEEFATPDLFQKYHPQDVERMRKLAQGEGQVAPGEIIANRILHRDGHYVWVHSALWICYRKPSGRLHHVAVNRDVTDLVEATAALRESEERYRVMAEASLDVITEIDEADRVVYASPNILEVFGRTLEDFKANPSLLFVHPEDQPLVEKTRAEAMGTGKTTRFEPYRGLHADGSWRWLETVGIGYRSASGEHRFMTMNRDVTARFRAERERHELEQRMQEAQRLESLGVLAGGVAHDFNNLLTPILGEASLALEDLPATSPLRARLEKIQRAAHRAAALTHQMLAYAGSESLEPDLLDLSELVLEMGRLLEGAVSGKTVLGYELAKDLPHVLADASQLSQVVMNLITNAVEAVGDGEGRVAIRTGCAVLGPASPAQHVLGEGPPPGRYAWFEVEDTGCGMDPETRSRIFDPFFTTKFTGRGLGLAAVRGIVRAHGGSIELESARGQGSRFRVLLPVAGTQVRAEEPGPREAALADWRSSATVLVVDDDGGVREVARDVLGRAGLRVLGAASGIEALAILEEHAGEIGAVLLDRTMPTLSGEDTFRELRRRQPELPVVLVSGYSEERAASHFAALDLAGFLAKPFLPNELLEKVRAALEP